MPSYYFALKMPMGANNLQNPFVNTYLGSLTSTQYSI